ncbi:GNAT family N-acetyltransferase [Paraglaciecola hydrolytica]|uniref:GCN5 family acetyltransferase n=1 Tax=Paraglaciecola hydrolytica TaxID=1799789 RepID=A0A136A597_9ALTE|nr:GNAT family protein [Paraglaciecola hydrolytica]KXI30418.1 GCN5 family acetyltransferase [Paraglaciecola hydrolytica]
MNAQPWLAAVELQGKNVTLVPLTSDHAAALVDAASDGELWNLWYTSVPRENSVKSYIEFALAQQNLGRALAFVVIENASQKIIGSTRFCNADPANRRVEIGYTWYAKSFQKTVVNTECKHLLLSYAFEALQAIAVEFRTHWHNQNSRNAIARLGAKQDGILRNHQVMADGSYRDTVVFSIINSEWLAVKAGLVFRLNSQS